MRRYSGLIVALTLLSLSSALAPAVSQGPLFAVESVSFRSSTGGSVYPGSSGARLVIGVRYLGPEVARSVHGCLDVPPGFLAQYRCVGARDLNGSYATSAHYGDVVYFTYVIDVDRAVAPVEYGLRLNVSARVGGLLMSEALELVVGVSPYPELQLELTDAYWSPEAYPGASGTTLYLVFRVGSIRVDSPSFIIELPEGFYPRTIRRTLGGIGSYTTFTVVASGISVSKSVAPGSYDVLVKVDATAVTDDGVRYGATTLVRVWVPVASPPQVLLKLVDAGWVGPRVPYGGKGSDYRVVLRLDDAVTIGSLVAVLSLPACAKSSNGSTSVLAYANRPIAYGEVFELVFNDITVACQSTAVAELALELLATKDGSEFWATQKFYVPLVVQNPTVDVRVASSYWSPSPAYPGGSRLSLIVVLENYDYVSLYAGVVRLVSSITEPGELTVSNVAIGSFGRSTVAFGGLSIPRSVTPGEYELKVVLDGMVSSGGASYLATMELRFSARVGVPPAPQLEVLSYGWADGRAFGHSAGNTLRVYIRNSAPGVTVRSLRAELMVPRCLKVDDLGRTFVSSATVDYGTTVALEFSNIDVVCGGGLYRVNLTVEVVGEIAGSSFWQDVEYGLALTVDDPVLNVEVLDAGWVSGIAYRNSSRLTPYITLVSYTRDSLASTLIRLRPVNAKLSDGSAEAAIAIVDPVPYGSSLTVRLPTLEVSGTEEPVEVELIVTSLVRYGQTVYNASRRLRVGLPLVSERVLVTSWSHVEYGGSPSPLLPTARGVRVSVLLTNLRPEPVSVTGIKVAPPQGIRVLGMEGDCTRAALAGGGTCGLYIVLDVQEDVEPRTYMLPVEVEYVKIVSGAALYGVEHLTVPLTVDHLGEHLPDIRVLEVFWGVQQPTPAFPNSRYVPMTLVVQNFGRYDALGVTVRASSEVLEPVVDSSHCSTRLPSGGTCQVTLYFNIPAPAKGFLRLNVSLEYHFSSFGAHARAVRHHTAWLYVEPLEPYGGALKPVSWGWYNNYNVFPNTENATFVVTVANRLPHSVAGVIAELYLPDGFRGNRGTVSTAYIDGPIRSYSSMAVGFRISVGGVSPGSYGVLIRLDYVIQSGGPGVRVSEEHRVEIAVADDRKAVELVSSSWVEGSAEPGTYGALLYLVVRNNLVDGMTGVFLQMDLPQGFFSSIDNSSSTRVPPVSQQVLQGLLVAGRPQQMALTQLLQQAYATAAPHGRGDIVGFIVPLNILVNTTGKYLANATLHYVDSWGTPRQCRFTVPLAVLGGIRYVEAYIDGGTIRISSRFTRATLRLRNMGSSPAYNVYITVFPYAQLPVVIASPSVHYVDRIEPGRDVELGLTLAYNPMGVYVAGAQTVVSYGTVPLIVGVVYRDVSGRLKMFNTTTVVVVEPFVDLVLRDSRAVITAGTLRVSGVLVNYGSATAYRVSVRVCAQEGACSESFIGDIESGAQRAFSVSAGVQGRTAIVNLTVYYYNAYNELQRLTLSMPAAVVPSPTTAVTPAEQQFVVERWVVIAAVAAFLVMVAYVILRVATSYYKRLRAASEVPPP